MILLAVLGAVRVDVLVALTDESSNTLVGILLGILSSFLIKKGTRRGSPLLPLRDTLFDYQGLPWSPEFMSLKPGETNEHAFSVVIS